MGRQSLISTELQWLTPDEGLDTYFLRTSDIEEILQLNLNLLQLKTFGSCISQLLCLSISNEINSTTLVISAVT